MFLGCVIDGAEFNSDGHFLSEVVIILDVKLFKMFQLSYTVFDQSIAVAHIIVAPG